MRHLFDGDFPPDRWWGIRSVGRGLIFSFSSLHRFIIIVCYAAKRQFLLCVPQVRPQYAQQRPPVAVHR